MTVDCVSEGRTLTAAVRGELDHHRAKEVMTELDEQIDMALPRRLTLDLSGLSFTDSSGIAVLIRVSRRMEQIKGELIVRGVPPQPWKVFQAAGLHKLIRFEQEEPPRRGRRTYINEGGKLRRAGISQPVSQRGVCPGGGGLLCRPAGPHAGGD